MTTQHADRQWKIVVPPAAQTSLASREPTSITPATSSPARFARALVGLDRAAARRALAEFADDRRDSRNQIDFVNPVLDHLAGHGTVDPSRRVS